MPYEGDPYTRGFHPSHPGDPGGFHPTPTPTPSAPTPEAPLDYDELLKKHVYEEVTTEKEPTELESLYEDYMTKALTEALEGPTDAEKAFQDSLTEYQTEYLEYQKQQLKNLQEAKELGEITGDLSPEEIDMLDTLEANAVQQLTIQVNKQLEDVMGHEIASLVSRGVLQGAIGEETMARLGEKSMEIIAQGTTDISSTRISQELGMRESTKDRDLRLQELVQRGELTREQAMAQMGTSAMGLSQAQSQFETSTALQGSQFASGLKQEWDLGKLNVASGLYTSSADRAMQQAIANQQASTARRGQTLDFFTGIFGF